MSNLFFFGDSITAGAWDEKGGWVARVIQKVMTQTAHCTTQKNDESKSFWCLPYNLGVSGDTIPDVINRLEREISARARPDENNQILISIGVNDSVYMVEENRPQFIDQEFSDNVHSLISLMKKITDQYAFIGLTPVDDALLDPIPWATEKAYRNSLIQNYETIIQNICTKTGTPFLPLFEKWISNDNYTSLLIDGVHPNSAGHALLAEQVSRFLLTDEFYEFHKE